MICSRIKRARYVFTMSVELYIEVIMQYCHLRTEQKSCCDSQAVNHTSFQYRIYTSYTCSERMLETATPGAVSENVVLFDGCHYL